MGQKLGNLWRKCIYNLIVNVQRSRFNQFLSTKIVCSGEVFSFYISLKREDHGNCTHDYASMSKNNPNENHHPIVLGKIKESHVGEVQKIIEHVKRSTSKKGFEKKNCTEQKGEEEISVSGLLKKLILLAQLKYDLFVILVHNLRPFRVQ